MEWQTINPERFHARYKGMFLYLYRDTDPIGSKRVWCWVLKNKNMDGLNGGCNDDKETARGQVEAEARKHDPK
jgi:hypothetical protein